MHQERKGEGNGRKEEEMFRSFGTLRESRHSWSNAVQVWRGQGQYEWAGDLGATREGEGPQNTLSLFCYLPKASFANGRQDMFAGKKCLTMLNANMSTAKTSWRCHILHKPKSCIWKDYLMCLFIKTSEKVLFYFTFIGLSLRGHFNICKETDFA